MSGASDTIAETGERLEIHCHFGLAVQVASLIVLRESLVLQRLYAVSVSPQLDCRDCLADKQERETHRDPHFHEVNVDFETDYRLDPTMVIRVAVKMHRPARWARPTLPNHFFVPVEAYAIRSLSDPSRSTYYSPRDFTELFGRSWLDQRLLEDVCPAFVTSIAPA